MSKDRQFITVEARAELLRLSFVSVDDAGIVDCAETRVFAPNDPDSETSSLLDQLALDAAAAAIRERTDWRGAPLIVIVGGGDVACHYFAMPRLEGKALVDSVRLKLGQQMHFPLNEAVVDVTRLTVGDGPTDDKIAIRATAIRTDVAKAAVAFAQQCKHELALISSSAVALTELARTALNFADHSVEAILHVEQSYSTLIVVGSSAPCLTTEIPVGVEGFTKALMRPIIAGDDVFQLDEPQALELRDRIGVPDRDADIGIHNLKGKSVLPLLEPALQRFAQQLTQWLTFVATSDGGGSVSRLHVVGAGAHMPGLAASLGHRLKLETDQPDWLSGQLRSTVAPADVEAIAPAILAARELRRLPDLLPEAEKKRRRVARFRRSTTKAGPIIAAATLGIAFLFNQVGGHLSQAVGQVESELLRVQSVVAENTRLQQERTTIAALKGSFDTFSRQTPNWIGFFKELSIILPKEIHVTRLSTRNDGREFRVVIDGNVVPSRRGASYDESVELALTALERSPFASAVHLVNSSRSEGEQSEYEGTLSVEVSLAFDAPPMHEKQ